jgi:hypothetical protein
LKIFFEKWIDIVINLAVNPFSLMRIYQESSPEEVVQQSLEEGLFFFVLNKNFLIYECVFKLVKFGIKLFFHFLYLSFWFSFKQVDFFFCLLVSLKTGNRSFNILTLIIWVLTASYFDKLLNLLAIRSIWVKLSHQGCLVIILWPSQIDVNRVHWSIHARWLQIAAVALWILFIYLFQLFLIDFTLLFYNILAIFLKINVTHLM